MFLLLKQKKKDTEEKRYRKKKEKQKKKIQDMRSSSSRLHSFTVNCTLSLTICNPWLSNYLYQVPLILMYLQY